MRRHGLLLVLVAATASCRGCSESVPSTPAVDAAQDAAAPLDAESLRRRARVPAMGWAAVTRDAAASGAVGFADVERSEAASASTVFEAASIAKTVIATCVLQLVEEQRLSLDADVSSYVGFRVRHPQGPITLRHLLTHTAAIFDGPDTSADASVPLARFLAGYFADAGGAFLDASPGTTMAYSNVGASLAALAVEHAAGRSFAVHAQARVFDPLGMTMTRFGREALPAGTRVAAPYAAEGTSFVRLAPTSHALYAVVDLYSSADDLARFARAVLRGGELDGTRILSSESTAEMLRVQLPDAAPTDALGWQVRTFGGRRVLGHEGEDLGVSTGLYLDPASGVGAIVLANGDAFQGVDSAPRTAAVGELIEKLLARASAAPASRIRSRDAD